MMMSVRSIRALKVLVPVVSAITFATQLTAVLTNQWLHTVESQPNPNFEKFSMPAELEFYKKATVSGLWTLCHNDPPDTEMRCFRIDYFSQEEYIPDQNDSTMAIPYAIKKAAVYILLATALMALGQSIYFLSQLFRSRRIYIFISGIPFILAGLLILTGIVVYISTFKGEVGYKLRPISQFQDALFDYRYGYSFLFLVASLLLSELTGTLTIFLYVSQKHFKIMIDTERDEVLKHNIINILRNHQPPLPPIPKAPMVSTSAAATDHPRLRITSEDYSPYGMSNSPEPSPTIPNQNFLTADFGVDSAFYQCGRHGSRGRRNSRSNDSYLGSPRPEDFRPTSHSRKVSQSSETDNNSQDPDKSGVKKQQQHEEKLIRKRSSSSMDDDMDLDLTDLDLVPSAPAPSASASNSGTAPRELHAARLLHRQMSTDLAESRKVHHAHRRRFLLQSHQQAFSVDEPSYQQHQPSYHHLQHQYHQDHPFQYQRPRHNRRPTENPIVPFILVSTKKSSTNNDSNDYDQSNSHRGGGDIISNRSTFV